MYLITGANGFVGSALTKRLFKDGFPVIASVRKKPIYLPNIFPIFEIGDLKSNNDWSLGLKNVKFVIHTAGRVHITSNQCKSTLSKFREENVEATANLALQSAKAGVKRFIFISSIKVNGDQTDNKKPFSSSDKPNPSDIYGVSKYEAEEKLIAIGHDTGMEVVIIRPTLIYGPNVKGNFLTMIDWLRKGWPLPFGSIKNLRSFIALDNLIDFIFTCLHHPAAAGEIFLVSDDDDISTPDLLSQIALSIGSKSKIFPLPLSVLKSGAWLFGKYSLAEKLCSYLQVDISNTKILLNWTPPLTMKQGLNQLNVEK